MKKSIIIFCAGIITLSLTAYSVINSDDLKNPLESKEIAVNTPTLNKTIDASIVEGPKDVRDFTTIYDENYTLHFEIDETDNKPSLVISIKLHNDSYFVSPHAKRDFKGKFFMDLGSYEHLDFEGDILETPRSIEEYDAHPFVNGIVNWVRVSTTYKQPLHIKSVEKFVVFGRVRFTIEPRCTLEEIPFGISYESGVIKLIDSKC